jgi:hypothetical protein
MKYDTHTLWKGNANQYKFHQLMEGENAYYLEDAARPGYYVSDWSDMGQ